MKLVIFIIMSTWLAAAAGAGRDFVKEGFEEHFLPDDWKAEATEGASWGWGDPGLRSGKGIWGSLTSWDWGDR